MDFKGKFSLFSVFIRIDKEKTTIYWTGQSQEYRHRDKDVSDKEFKYVFSLF